MTMIRKTAAGLVVLAGVLLPGWAHALINPNFTPIHLSSQSDVIIEVQLSPAKDSVVTATVKTVIKGKFAAKTVPLSLKNTAFKEQAQAVEKLVKETVDAPALFFIGKINEKGAAPGGGGGGGGGEGGDAEKGFLHINGQWVSFDKDKDDSWLMNEISSQMLQTWNGGTDMLRKVLDYILNDPEAVVPCVEGVSWGAPKKFATVAGKVLAVAPVTLVDGGSQVLYVTADSGDRLFEHDAKARELKDTTAAHKLSTKSLVATWGDLNADGRTDLASWNGETVAVYLQEADGTLKAGPVLAKDVLKGGCKSLAVIDSGAAGKPAILIGAAVPLLWTPAFEKDAPQVAKPVAAGEPPADLGAAGRCFAADFDGDGVGDILQLFVKGGRIFKGKAPGQFEAPKPSAVALGTGPSDAFLGDFDCDGLLDVVTLGDATQVWNNRGKMEFVNVMGATGELMYKGNTDSHAGATGDINGDGRQDVICFYAGGCPHINFNRGFRSFGHANNIDFDTTGVIPGIGEGQQTGCWTDLNGDGIQELVIVLKNGDTWFLPVETGSDKAGVVRVMLAAKAPTVGPVNVVGYRGKRCLGAWNVSAGTTEGFVAQAEAGPVAIKWQLPGGKPQSKEITLENAPVKLMLQ